MGKKALHWPRIPAFTAIGRRERDNVALAMKRPLSGYLGGIRKSSGTFVNRLEHDWAKAVGAEYAVACNSATSGLLAACIAAGIRRGDRVWTTPFSMSATTACAVMLGADITFIDIEPTRYSIDMEKFPVGQGKPKAIIVANIFGHPAYLRSMRSWCDKHGVILIEDNAQSPFAMEDGQYTGTIGHMGVFSFNVHKHIQAGEGGIVTTNQSHFRDRLCDAINHGELGGGATGLNLRMTEVTAAIVCAQLPKAPDIIEGRRKLARNLSEIFALVPWIEPSGEDKGCHHAYYLWTARVPADLRDPLVEFLNGRNVPVNGGYSVNLCDVFDPSQKKNCKVTDEINNSLISFEVCAYNVSRQNLDVLESIVKQVEEYV